MDSHLLSPLTDPLSLLKYTQSVTHITSTSATLSNGYTRLMTLSVVLDLINGRNEHKHI
jgi:hypothetical protein